MPKILTLYYREGCHLCTVMLSEISTYLQKGSVELERIDIDEDPIWLERYNTLIPVLHVDGEPVCKYRLDKERLEAFLYD